MIISASRRTDIPAYYSSWFINRIKEGFVLVRNPVNKRQISRVSLSPSVVDGIVFWTKNPAPMFGKLKLLEDYIYYFQFTITSCGKDVEPNVPSKNDKIIPAFQRLSDTIGTDRVVWRYDPIMLSSKYTPEYHITCFEKMTRLLSKYTKKCTISFIDYYKNTAKNTKDLNILDFSVEDKLQLAKTLADIAHAYGLKMDACAEESLLRRFGVEPARCIDGLLLGNLLNCRLDIEKDKNQRAGCGCASSVDIGMYNSCLSGCKYCYANHNDNLVRANSKKHNPLSPLLYGEVDDNDIVRERKATISGVKFSSVEKTR
jgi:DNA repair photolyase